MQRKILLIVGTIFLVSFMKSVNNQTKSEFEQKKSTIENYLKLQSPTFHERYLAVKYFSKAKKEEIGSEVMAQAIKIFFKEVEGRKKYIESAGKPARIKDKASAELRYMNSEEFMEYFGLLCEIVSRSKDETVLPLLVDYCLEPKILINYEEQAVGPVINILKTSPDPTGRHLAALALGYFMEDKKDRYIARGVTRSKIKATLIDSAVSDKEFHVRTAAVLALGKSGDVDLIPSLEKIAVSDPYHFETKARAGIDKDVAPGMPITRYPVRFAAQEALKKLREGKKKE